MALVEDIHKWKNKKVFIIGEALIDKYIFGFANKISPDAPVPNVKIEKSNSVDKQLILNIKDLFIGIYILRIKFNNDLITKIIQKQ